MNTGYDDVHDLVGAYVLDALDADERAHFEEHLADCAPCRAEAASLAETSALLAGDEVAPPPSLREDLLALIGDVEQLPVADTADTATHDPDTGTGTDTTGTGTGTDADATPVADLETRRHAGGRRRFLGAAGTPLLMAAAVFAVLMAVGAAWWQPWSDDPETTLTATEQVLAADDARRASQQLTGGAEATVVVSPSMGRAVIVTDGMAPAPEGKDYELWLQTPAGDLRPAGLMPDRGNATVLLKGDASAATGVGITVEPDGGSEQPTTAPIAFVELTPASTTG